MFALARFARLSMLLAVGSAFAFTQGCAAETEEDSAEAIRRRDHDEPGCRLPARHALLLLGPQVVDHDAAEPPSVLVPDGVEPVDRGERRRPPRDCHQPGRPGAGEEEGRSRRHGEAARARGCPRGRRHRAELPAEPRGDDGVPARADGRHAREPRLHAERRGLQHRQPARRRVRRPVQHAPLQRRQSAPRALARAAPTRSRSSARRHERGTQGEPPPVDWHAQVERRAHQWPALAGEVPEGLPHADLRRDRPDDEADGHEARADHPRAGQDDAAPDVLLRVRVAHARALELRRAARSALPAPRAPRASTRSSSRCRSSRPRRDRSASPKDRSRTSSSLRRPSAPRSSARSSRPATRAASRRVTARSPSRSRP